jgi:2-polyprenyl-3-methyl-5-hydroxy-6-metoxy-1,4-benzoquinol methylase
MTREPLTEARIRPAHNRRCPYCRSDSSRAVGTRVDIWAKCRNCRSIFRDITPARFQQIHDEAFQDSWYIESSNALAGREPWGALWAGLALPGASVLEIGPGTGQLLAAARAAGCSVEAVESSAVHRDYIRDTWSIGSLYSTMDEIPDGRTFDTIVAINVFEHIYDIADFLGAVRKVLAPGGTFFLSMPNALSLEATVLRCWWAMCKVHDHVSFPSSAGLATAAQTCGLRVERIWSTGLPFEFPVSAVIAARDRSRTRRGIGQATEHSQPREAAAGPVLASGTVNPAAKTALVRFYSAAAPFDPVYRLRGALGRAGSLKARLTRSAGRMRLAVSFTGQTGLYNTLLEGGG